MTEEPGRYLVAGIAFAVMDQNPSTTSSAIWRASARRSTLSVVLWAFGMATTLLLVGLWGRAVSYDEPTVQASARSVVDAEVATDRIYSWIEEGVAASADVDSVTAQEALSELRNNPEVDAAVDAVLAEFIGALFTPEGETAELDLAESLEPVVPVVAAEFAEHDVAVDESSLNAALAEADRIDLATGDAATVARVVDDARTFLSLIVVIAALTLAVTGVAAVWLADDHLAMARTLATRILMSAVSFAVLFRIGSWVLDPQGGGSPIAGGGSILLRSNAQVFVIIALGSAAVAGGLAWFLNRRSPQVDPPDSESIPLEDDTRELVTS